MAQPARSSAGHRRGDALSQWDGWNKVGILAANEPIPAASSVRRFDVLQLDVVTRWGSVLTMLRSFVSIAPALMDVMQESPDLFEHFDGQLPTTDDIAYVRAAITVLEPFEAVTTMLGGSTYSTLARVPDVVNKLYAVLQPTKEDNMYADELRRAMRDAFEFKFEPLFSKANLATMAAYVHPETVYKLFTGGYVSEDVLIDIEECLVSEMVTMADDGPAPGVAVSPQSSKSASLFDDVMTTTPRERALKEIATYRRVIDEKFAKAIVEEERLWRKSNDKDHDDFGCFYWYIYFTSIVESTCDLPTIGQLNWRVDFQ